MKRSRINDIMADADDQIRRHGFVLPPFARWTPEAFRTDDDETDTIFRDPIRRFATIIKDELPLYLSDGDYRTRFLA